MTRKAVHAIPFDGDWPEAVAKLLDASSLTAAIPVDKPILLKPNLVTDDPPPITTPVELVEAVIVVLRRVGVGNEIVVGEGCGATEYDTWRPFKALGYEDMAERLGVTLIDLNEAPLVHLRDSALARWPEMWLPEIVMDSYLISIPVLKAHSLAEVTLTMKNMMGCAPPKHFNAGSWRKSAFHQRMQASILDLNKYRTPDFTILDATVGMKDAHLWGDVCEPPPGVIAASFDPVAIDAYGTELLKRDWRSIAHIAEADGVLGNVESGGE